jgi:hypothetical protein
MRRHVSILTLMIFAGTAGLVQAKATWVKKAQADAPTIKSCLDCHTAATKITATDLKLNARGDFLMDKKKEAGASEIDFKWLKDYKEPAAKK